MLYLDLNELKWNVKIDALDLLILEYLNMLDEDEWTTPIRIANRIRIVNTNTKVRQDLFTVRLRKLHRYGLVKAKEVDGVTYYKLSKNVKFKGDDIIYLRVNGMIIKLIEEKSIRPKLADIPLRVLKDIGVDIFEGVKLDELVSEND